MPTLYSYAKELNHRAYTIILLMVISYPDNNTFESVWNVILSFLGIFAIVEGAGFRKFYNDLVKPHLPADVDVSMNLLTNIHLLLTAIFLLYLGMYYYLVFSDASATGIILNTVEGLIVLVFLLSFKVYHIKPKVKAV